MLLSNINLENLSAEMLETKIVLYTLISVISLAALIFAAVIIEKATADPERDKKGIIIRFFCIHNFKWNRRQPMYNYKGKKVDEIPVHRCLKCGTEAIKIK
jgi:hypothetical protein